MIEPRAPINGGPTHNGVREFFRFLNRRKIIIVTPALLIVGFAWSIAATTPPRFAAEAVLALDVRKVEVVDKEVVSRFPQESLALRTELDVITSRSLAEQVIDRIGLAADPDTLREAGAAESLWQNLACNGWQALGFSFPRFAGICSASTSSGEPTLTRPQLTDWLIGNLKVSNDGRSYTILVSFTSGSPERAARIANAVAETYLADQVRTKAMAIVRARDWLGEKLIKMRQELEISEAAVDDFRRQSGLIEARGATVPAQRLSELNTQLVDARLERARAEAKLQAARESETETISDVLASPLILQLRKDMAQINSEIAENRDHSTLYKLNVLDARAAVVRKQMSQEMKRILASLAGEVQAARKKEAQLTLSFQQMESQLSNAAHSGVRLNQLQREADANRSIYDTFLTRYKQTMEQEGLAAADARLVSRAEPPKIAKYPKKLQFLLLGTFGGLAIGAALAFARERLDRRVLQASEVEAVTGIPVFGLLPKVPRWRGLQPQDYPVKDPRSRFCAALVRIHTALQAPKSSNRGQVILVTSAKPADGKTAFCTSLARSLAKDRTRVLVIDADPFRSRVASAFGASAFPNFGPGLEHGVRLCDIVLSDAKSAAHFIAAPNEDDFQLLLHSGGFAALLEEARRAYDVVIIDTPPVMTSAVSAVLGRCADTCLFLVRWGRTSWDDMQAAVGFLRLCRIRLDGIVMASVDSRYSHYGLLGGYGTPPPSGPSFWRLGANHKSAEIEPAR
jgi:uncharacterized protein involved in exopolysaccharide biosynthesis/Mrp family chromosome partitioning ATPase